MLVNWGEFREKHTSKWKLICLPDGERHKRSASLEMSLSSHKDMSASVGWKLRADKFSLIKKCTVADSSATGCFNVGWVLLQQKCCSSTHLKVHCVLWVTQDIVPSWPCEESAKNELKALDSSLGSELHVMFGLKYSMQWLHFSLLFLLFLSQDAICGGKKVLHLLWLRQLPPLKGETTCDLFPLSKRSFWGTRCIFPAASWRAAQLIQPGETIGQQWAWERMNSVMHVSGSHAALLVTAEKAKQCKHARRWKASPWSPLPFCTRISHLVLSASTVRAVCENSHVCGGSGCVSLEWGSRIPSLSLTGIFCCVQALAPRNVRSQNGNGPTLFRTYSRKCLLDRSALLLLLLHDRVRRSI